MADWPTTGERPYGAKVKAYVDDKLPKDGTSAMTGPLAVDRGGNVQITTRNSSAPADNRKWTQTVQSSDGRVTFDAYNDANAWVGTRFEILRSGGVVVDGIRHLKGSGSPEGVVSGPVGSRYIDIAATNGAVEWVKFSGTGNTGWRVAYGDTGWRDVTTDVVNGFTTSSPFMIRRTPEATWVRGFGISGAAATASTFYTLPSGFRPQSGNWFRLPVLQAGAGVIGGTMDVQGQSGILSINNRAAVTDGSVTFQFPCNAVWPTTLPGTAV